MRIVDVHQLKSQLSECVHAARAGETVLISDHDELVAELGPLRDRQHQPGPFDSVIEELAARGLVTPAAENKRGWTWKPPALGLSGGAARNVLQDLRRDR